jgi:hypothetical protein
MLLWRQGCQRDRLPLVHYEQAVFRGRIDEYETGDVARVLGLKESHEHAAPRGTDHDKRPLLTGAIEERAQVTNDPDRCFYILSLVAPAAAGPIVRAHPRDLRDLRLHKGEVDRKRAGSRLDDDRRRPAARAVEVEATSTDVNEATERLPRVRGPGSVLGEGDDHRNQQKADHQHSAAHAPPSRQTCHELTIPRHDRNYSRSTDSGTIHGVDFEANVFSGLTAFPTQG